MRPALFAALLTDWLARMEVEAVVNPKARARAAASLADATCRPRPALPRGKGHRSETEPGDTLVRIGLAQAQPEDTGTENLQ